MSSQVGQEQGTCALKQWGLSNDFPASIAATNSELLLFNYLPPGTKIQRISDLWGSPENTTFPNPALKFWEFVMTFKALIPRFHKDGFFPGPLQFNLLSLEVKSSSTVKIFYHCNLVTNIYTICPKFSHYSCHSQLFTGTGTCSFRGNLQLTTSRCTANCRQWALEQNWSAV